MTTNFSHKTRFRFRRVAVFLLISCFLAPGAMASTDTIIFGSQAWPGATIKTEVARQILEKIGYDTEATSGTSTLLSVGLRQGDIDVMLENWMPDMKEIIQKNTQSGKATQLAVNIKDARLDLVVPAYVWNAGVHSIADLHKYADQFDHKILGIESGNVDNEIVKDSIGKNTYKLGDWQLIPSSTAAMLVEVGKHIKNKQWVAFIGWRPHWMNSKYDLKYLNDPQNMFSGTSTVLTLANSAFVEKHPNVIRFLKQFIQTTETENDWIYDYGYKKKDKSVIARTWIKNHPDTIAQWLKGVTSAEGNEPAIQTMAQ